MILIIFISEHGSCGCVYNAHASSTYHVTTTQLHWTRLYLGDYEMLTHTVVLQNGSTTYRVHKECIPGHIWELFYSLHLSVSNYGFLNAHFPVN